MILRNGSSRVYRNCHSIAAEDYWTLARQDLIKRCLLKKQVGTSALDLDFWGPKKPKPVLVAVGFTAVLCSI